MGNRAVITTKENFEKDGIGIYVHWNGGRDSIEGFLAYCKLRGFRKPEYDSYGWLYLATVIGNFFGDGLSAGIDRVSELDCNNYDNGVYFIQDWEIVGRKYAPNTEQNSIDLLHMLKYINGTQPEEQQLKTEDIEEFVAERKRWEDTNSIDSLFV